MEDLISNLKKDIEDSLDHFIKLSVSRSDDHRYIVGIISGMIKRAIENDLKMFVKVKLLKRG